MVALLPFEVVIVEVYAQNVRPTGRMTWALSLILFGRAWALLIPGLISGPGT